MLLKKMSLTKKVVASFAAISLFITGPIVAQIAAEGGKPNVQGSTNQQIGFSDSLSNSAETQENKTLLVAGVNAGLGVGFVHASNAAKVACKNKADKAAAAAAQAGAAPAGVTGDSCTLGVVLDMLAIGSFMQAASGLTDSLTSGLTKNKTRNPSKPNIGPNGNGSDNPNSNPDFDSTLSTPDFRLPNGPSLEFRKVNPNAELQKLEAKGYKIDKSTGTITTPDGKKFSQAALNSAAQSLALSDPAFKEAYDSLMSQAAAASSGFKAVRMDVDSSGGGGGGGKSNARSVSSYPGFKFAGLGDQPKAASVAGLTKMANGEPIGVAGDDIFKMMQRAYGSRQGHGMFIEE